MISFFSLKLPVLILALSAAFFPIGMHAESVETVTCGYFKPIYHNNGVLAWNGVRQTDTYQEANAFFHANGLIAWDGMKRTRNGWGEASANGIFYYNNGQQAWGGIDQTLNILGEHYSEGIFYHPDGKELWCGVPQTISIFGDTRADAKFFHSNGVKAWGGLKQFVKSGDDRQEDGNVYYRNGQLAWSGLRKDPVYDSAGKVIAYNVDFVIVYLGHDNFLYVDHLGNYDLYLKLGEGYELRATPTGVYIKLYDVVINDL